MGRARLGETGGDRGEKAYFDEAIIEAEIMSDAILPALFVVSVIGEPVHDELVDL